MGRDAVLVMDPNLLSFFSVPNNQTLNPVDQNGESSAAGANSQNQQDASWRQSGLNSDIDFTRTSAQSGGNNPSFNAGSGAPSDISFTQPPMPSPYTQNNKATLPARGNPRGQPRRRDAHDRKRPKVDSDAGALESLDYWIQFDDDDADKTGSFEIDFSKRYDLTNHNRYVS